MNTNYQMLVELNKEYTPARRGIVGMSEIRLIRERLCLDEMDYLALRNLRDFVVMFFNIEMDKAESEGFEKVMEINDKMSAIVSVIDEKIFYFGEEA